MTIDALRVLAEKVEAGAVTRSTIEARADDCFTPDHQCAIDAGGAYKGSLDAAKALHEAVLPGWTASVHQNTHHKFWRAYVTRMISQEGATDYEAMHDTNPARAWLLSIIRAKIAVLESEAACVT